ncbi:DEAD/DEAH box helicase [Pseudoalteromonas xiamenensis]|uniref:DEAD/DEAH box helicase n=1 Tax=Pseudoalteromonas xiamenensis TaxID=882626 RepID=UPI0035E750AE
MIKILGARREGQVVGELLEKTLQKIPTLSGYLYRGFPILSTSEQTITLDSVLCSEQHGVVIFHFVEGKDIPSDFQELVDEVHLKVVSKLQELPELTIRRKLAVPVNSIVYGPAIPKGKFPHELEEALLLSRDADDIKSNIELEVWESPHLLRAVLSRLQSLTSLKKRKQRSYVKREDSKGAVLKKLENKLATLDDSQTNAVLETVSGVQRIRGLAGSGKTVVLARKIAHLHAQNPNWKIAVTFNSRSLKKQLERLITVFYEDANGEKPDLEEQVQIIHAWGSPKSSGIYYKACLLHNAEYLDFGAARRLSGSSGDAFDYACQKLNEQISEDKKLFDLILIDEAQDFSPDFLRLCYSMLDHPKRLIYAYDELQNLGDSSMPSPEEIWGVDDNGTPIVSFKDTSQDLILDTCYRNPGPILSAAHALGFGIYRKPMIQMFEHHGLWEEIGYQVLSGELKEGELVSLGRTDKSSPCLLSSHNQDGELIKFLKFNSRAEEYSWVAQEIIRNIREEEILPSDIVVIHPDIKRMKSEVGGIRNILFQHGINSSIAGITGSPDEFIYDDQVTFTSIYRAKGNEAAMVYVIGADYCNTEFELSKKRNILFTAMTRTKAWLRISGCFQQFDGLFDEYAEVLKNNFHLNFQYPTEEMRLKMKVVNRDMTSAEKNKVNKARHSASSLAALLSGEVNPEDIPEELRLALLEKLKG